MVPRVVVVAAVLTVAAGCGAVPDVESAPSDAGESTSQPPSFDPSPEPTVETFEGLSQDHVTGTYDYPQIPPAGGPHSPDWQNCGFYDEPVGNENAVHSLEHGAVWITHVPDLPADQVAHLRDLAPTGGYVLVSPYEGLPSPVVASAWGVQVKLPSATDPALDAFLSEYVQGPQTPEAGAPCTGGIGSPAGETTAPASPVDVPQVGLSTRR